MSTFPLGNPSNSPMTVRLALRTLFKTPFVTSVAILSLALGIGANTAIYSVFDQILRRPLPVPEPDRLVNLGAPPPKPGSTSCNQAGDCDRVFSYPMFRDLERAQTVFTGRRCALPVRAPTSPLEGQTTISGDGSSSPAATFRRCGLKPALGRLLGPDDDKVARRGAGGGAEPRLLDIPVRPQTRACSDQAITINGQPMTVVGVAPEGFDGTTLGARPVVFVPITMRDQLLAGRPHQHASRIAAATGPTVRAAQARRLDRAGADSAINVPVQSGPERRRSAAAGRHERPDHGRSSGRGRSRSKTAPAARRRSRREARSGADPAARRHRLRHPDRVREHRQPAARPLGGPGRRNGHPAVDRRQPPASHRRSC